MSQNTSLCSTTSLLPLFLIILVHTLSFNTSEDELSLYSSIRHHLMVNDIYKSTPTAYVVLAADFDSPASIANYGILTPLTSFIWFNVFNVTPVVILGTKRPGRLTTATETAFASLVRRAGGRIHCISKSETGEDGNEAGASLFPELVGAALITSLQVSRMASVALRYLNDFDAIITSDADIWPMSKTFWRGHISKLLDSENKEVFVYNGPFFHGQRQIKDCNFIALTSIAANVRTWRDMVLRWHDSVKFAPSPRDQFCAYPDPTDKIPILPWYTGGERRNYSNNNSFNVLFSDLLFTFLEEGRQAYGRSVWEKEIWSSVNSYKLKRIWDYDQVLAAEMILAAQPELHVNNDLRRLDKFGVHGSISDYKLIVKGKSVEDFTDTHLDGVENSNWWRLAEIWSLVFDKSTSRKLSTESNLFINDVQDFYDVIRGTNDEVTRSSLFMRNNDEGHDANRFCDSV